MGYGTRSQRRRVSGAEGSRTPDLLNAIQALSQLSYSPEGVERCTGGRWPREQYVVELRGFEPLASSVRLMRSPS